MASHPTETCTDSLRIKWRERFYLLGTPEGMKTLGDAVQQAKEHRRPIFVVFSEFLTGFLDVWQLSLVAEAIRDNFVIAQLDLDKEPDLASLKGKAQAAILNDQKTILASISDASNGVQVCNALIQAWPGTVPQYLKIARKEFMRPSFEVTTFGMGCYWQGESSLGGIQGVTQLTPAWFGSGEVVEVVFDPSETSYDKLAHLAKSKGWNALTHSSTQEKTAQEVGLTTKMRNMSDPLNPVGGDESKHDIKSDSVYARVPMTPYQQAKANAWATNHKHINEILSPNQLQLMEKIQRELPKISSQVHYFPDSIEELPHYEKRLIEALGY